MRHAAASSARFWKVLCSITVTVCMTASVDQPLGHVFVVAVLVNRALLPPNNYLFESFD